MRVRRVVVLLVTLGLGLSGGAARASSATAASAPDCRVAAVEDDHTTVRCTPGFATDRDQVLVYGRDGRAVGTVGERWRPAMLDEVWVLDVGSRGRASLIIDFHPVGGDVAADIYDDTDGDAVVSEAVSDGRVRIRENNGRWSMRVQARDGWWVRDGKVNFNLDITLRSSIEATVDYKVYERLIKPGGDPYAYVHVRDPRGSGRPAYEWRQMYPPLDPDSGFVRTAVMTNTLGDEVPMTPGGLPWPYLNGEPWGLTKPYFHSPAPVEVDWSKGRVVTLGEFVASRAKVGNYFLYSITRIDEATITTTDFENPFGFYSLAGTPEDYPDLVVRMVHFPAGDPHMQLPVPTQQI